MTTGQKNPTAFADQSSWHSICRSHTRAHTHTHTTHNAHMHSTSVCAHTVLKTAFPSYVRADTTTSTGYITDSSFNTTSYTCKVTETKKGQTFRTSSWDDTLLGSTQETSKQAGNTMHSRHTHHRKGVWLCDSAVKNKRFTRQLLATTSFGYKQNVL